MRIISICMYWDYNHYYIYVCVIIYYFLGACVSWMLYGLMSHIWPLWPWDPRVHSKHSKYLVSAINPWKQQKKLMAFRLSYKQTWNYTRIKIRERLFLKLFSCKGMTIWINWKERTSATATTRSHENNMELVGKVMWHPVSFLTSHTEY